MSEWNQIVEKGRETFELFKTNFLDNIPNILGGILVLIIGWLIAKGISYVVHKILILININRLFAKDRVKKVLDEANIQVELSDLLSKVVYWIIFIFVLIMASKIFGWTNVYQEFSGLMVYVPRLLSGAVILILGLLLANFVKNFIQNISSVVGIGDGNIISRLIFLIMLVIIVIASLKHMGINVQFFSTNILIIIGSISIAFAIGFAISSKNILKNILASSYNKKNFRIGQKIRLGKLLKTEGTIIDMTNTSVFVETRKGVIVIPAMKFMEDVIETIDEGSSEE